MFLRTNVFISGSYPNVRDNLAASQSPAPADFTSRLRWESLSTKRRGSRPSRAKREVPECVCECVRQRVSLIAAEPKQIRQRLLQQYASGAHVHWHGNTSHIGLIKVLLHTVNVFAPRPSQGTPHSPWSVTQDKVTSSPWIASICALLCKTCQNKLYLCSCEYHCQTSFSLWKDPESWTWK